jgi:predicted transcriptional regulator
LTPKEITKEFLSIEYFTNGKSLAEISEESGVSVCTISKYFKKFGFKKRYSSLKNLTRLKQLEDKEFLVHLYVDCQKPIAEIAREIGSTDTTLKKYFHKHNIEIRSSADHQRRFFKKQFDKIDNKEILYQEYIINKLNHRQIAEKYGIHKSLVSRLLKRHSIPSRDILHIKFDNEETIRKILDKKFLTTEYIENRKSAKKISLEIGVNKKTLLKYLKLYNIPVRESSELLIGSKETFDKVRDKEYLYNQYVVLGRTAEDIADEIGVCKGTILDHLESVGIVRRSHLEYRHGRSKLHEFKLIPLLEKYNIKHKSSHYVRDGKNKVRFEIDEYLADYKIFLELQGLYWHGYLTKDKAAANGIRRDIIKYKFLVNEYQDHKVIYILESDFKDGLAEQIISQIVNPLSKKKEFWDKTQYKFSLSNRDEIRNFVKLHHYLGNVPSSKYIFKSTKDNEIVAASVFSSPSRNEQRKKYGENCLELSRYCSSEHGTNLGSWFLSKCLKYVKERPIITYADITRHPGKPSHNGTLYKSCNFTCIGITGTNYRYITTEGDTVHKKAVWVRAKKCDSNEKEQAEKEELIKFYEWPKSIYIYR